MEDIKSFLKQEIEELTFEEVENDQLLISTNILDSITIVELSVAIEDEYSIKIPLNDLKVEQFDSIDIMATYIQSKQ
jgi:acyl carrier protein